MANRKRPPKKPLTIDEIRQKRFAVFLKKYQYGRATASEIAELVASGVLPSDQGQTARLRQCGSQSELAGALARHFHGQLSCEINPPLICRWKIGQGLPDGVPLPPAKINNLFDTEGWKEWITAHILPEKGIARNGHARALEKDIFQKADEAEACKKIDAAAREAIARSVDEKTWSSVEEHRRQLRNIGAIINACVTQFAENRAAETMMETIKTVGADERITELLRIAACEACSKMSDELRAAIAAELRKSE